MPLGFKGLMFRIVVTLRCHCRLQSRSALSASAFSLATVLCKY